MKSSLTHTSPFLYGVTVSSQDFADRVETRAKLYSNLTSGINTTLISPRRWGKSSLVEKVVETINVKDKLIKTVVIDLFATESEEQFLELFAKEVIKASSNKWQDWMNEGATFFKHLMPKISIGVDPNTDFNLTFNWQEAIQHKTEILNLPEVIAAQKGVKFIICLDEFQNLASFNNYELLEKSMRASWQRQKHVTYCLLGSKRHMMADIFNNPSKPFYRFGDIMLLKKIDEVKWLDFIIMKFNKTGKSITKELAVLIPRLMKNHSWYVQQLAHYVWQKTEKEVSVEVLNAALNELIYANMPFYQREIEDLSVSQINFLKAVVNDETQMTSQAVMEKYRLGTPRNVSKNKEKLILMDMVDFSNKKYELLDPAFELWFLKQFYGKSFNIENNG